MAKRRYGEPKIVAASKRADVDLERVGRGSLASNHKDPFVEGEV